MASHYSTASCCSCERGDAACAAAAAAIDNLLAHLLLQRRRSLPIHLTRSMHCLRGDGQATLELDKLVTGTKRKRA